MKYCESCNTDYLDEKQFCRRCGSPLIEKKIEPARSAFACIQCSVCGNEVASGKKFCRHCGAAVDSTASANPLDAGAAQELCPSCATPLAPGKKFCRHCGLNLAPPPPASPLTSLPLSKPSSDGTATRLAIIDDTSVAGPRDNPVMRSVTAQSEVTPFPVITSAAVARESPQEKFERASVSAAPEPTAGSEAQVISIKAPLSTSSLVEPSSILTGPDEARRSNLLLIVGGSAIALATVGFALWYFFFRAEARITRAIDAGKLVTPAGTSAYDLYMQSKTNLGTDARSRLRDKAFGTLLASASSLTQKRMQGESLKLSDVDELARLYDWAVDLAPDNRTTLAGQAYAHGLASNISGKPKDALPLLLHATEYSPTWALAFNELGKTYVKLNDHHHAADAYQKAISIDPNWVFPQINLAGVYLHDKQWDQAEQGYLKAIQMDTTLSTPWYFLGQVYQARRQTDKAIDAYEHAVQLAEKRPSSAFRVDILQNRIDKLKSKVATQPTPIAQSESAPTAQSQYGVRLFNCDDGCHLIVGSKELIAGFGQDTGFIDIGEYLHPGQNTVLMQVWNQTGAITYGFEITRDQEAVFQQICGTVGVQGCDNNRTVPMGLARQFSFTVVK